MCEHELPCKICASLDVCWMCMLSEILHHKWAETFSLEQWNERFVFSHKYYNYRKHNLKYLVQTPGTPHYHSDIHPYATLQTFSLVIK